MWMVVKPAVANDSTARRAIKVRNHCVTAFLHQDAVCDYNYQMRWGKMWMVVKPARVTSAGDWSITPQHLEMDL
jgi:hypothetical protein